MEMGGNEVVTAGTGGGPVGHGGGVNVGHGEQSGKHPPYGNVRLVPQVCR
jgi:hypothetical protein